MRQFNEDNLTAAVVERFQEAKDERFRQIVTSAVKHLHAFAREVHLTEEEWFEGIKYLTAVGQKCRAFRITSAPVGAIATRRVAAPASRGVTVTVRLLRAVRVRGTLA